MRPPKVCGSIKKLLVLWTSQRTEEDTAALSMFLALCLLLRCIAVSCWVTPIDCHYLAVVHC